MSADWHSQAFYRISAMGLILNDRGEVLMVNEHGDFSLPGGGWEYGETLHECLVRELHEEILLTSDFTESVVAALPFYNPGKEAWQMLIVSLIHYNELQFAVGEHASDVRWFAPEDIDVSTQAGKLTKKALEVYDANF